MGDKEKENRNVFVVDGNKIRRKTIKWHLGKSGIVCREAESAEQAEKLLNNYIPDLVLIDTELPDQDGMELCRWIRSKEWLRSTPVMMMSSRHDLSRRLQGFLAGACRYLCRPFTADILIEEIEMLLKKQEAIATINTLGSEKDFLEDMREWAY